MRGEEGSGEEERGRWTYLPPRFDNPAYGPGSIYLTMMVADACHVASRTV